MQVTRYRPQLAVPADLPPSGPGWCTELKHDGYRIGAHLREGRVQLESRNAHDWTARFSTIAQAVSALPVHSALLDGEAVVLTPDGRTSFQDLQNAWRSHRPPNGLAYFAFDLLELEGVSLEAEPLRVRKELLSRLVAPLGPGVIRYSQHLEGEPASILESARQLGAEGIVCKKLEARYHAGRHASWVKLKCIRRDDFVIGGFTEPNGARSGIGALLLGERTEAGLRYCGGVGTGQGWTGEFLTELRRGLESIRQRRCPFIAPPPVRGHWVQPVLVCEVNYTERTTDGTLRHPSFAGFRPDKSGPTA